MNLLQIIWRSLVCLILSSIGMTALFFAAAYATPTLFQDSVWGRIGILAVGIEFGGFVIYLAMMLITGGCIALSSRWRTPALVGCIPILYGLVRYPWWLIQVCQSIPTPLGIWQWIIIIAWIITWITMFGISLGALIGYKPE